MTRPRIGYPAVLGAALLFLGSTSAAAPPEAGEEARTPDAAVPAQDTPEGEVLAVVDRLFTAMRMGDGEAAKAVLHPDAVLVRNVPGVGDRIQVSGVDEFVQAVDGAEEGELRERIWDAEVRIAGGLASVWAPYDFHRGDAFSHCGVDAFHLGRTADGWRIVAISYTTRTDGCEGPPPS